MPRHGAASLKITRAVLAAWGDRCWLNGPGCTKIATTRDHVIPYSLGGTDDLGNLRPACRTCNSRRGNRVLSGYGATIHVVMGPPGAGKSTLVRERARLGDIVVDLDRIARALMPETLDERTHVYPEHVRHVAIGARTAAIERATRLVVGCDVWLIHADPSPKDLELYRFLRYDVITVDPGRPIVEARVRAERPPHEQAWVAKWYSRHATPAAIAAASAPALAPAGSPSTDTNPDW